MLIFTPTPWNRECRHAVSNVLDRWSRPLLWHLSNINAICNFWPQLQILGGSADPLIRPSEPLTMPAPCEVLTATVYRTISNYIWTAQIWCYNCT